MSPSTFAAGASFRTPVVEHASSASPIGGDSDTLAFLQPGKFPEFEGDEAWFLALKHPRNRFEFIRQGRGEAWNVTDMIVALVLVTVVLAGITIWSLNH